MGGWLGRIGTMAVGALGAVVSGNLSQRLPLGNGLRGLLACIVGLMLTGNSRPFVRAFGYGMAVEGATRGLHGLGSMAEGSGVAGVSSVGGLLRGSIETAFVY